MTDTKRKPWLFDFMKRVEALFQEGHLDSSDVGYLFLLTQMNHGGQPKVLYGHLRMADRFRLSRERTGGRLAKYESLGLIRALHRPISPGRHGGDGQVKQYVLLPESCDVAVTPIKESSDDNVTSFHACFQESCDGTCDGGVTPTRTLEEQEPPAGSSTIPEPPPAGLLPGHRLAMTNAWDSDAARSHFDAIRDLLRDERPPERWQLGHSGGFAKVPNAWTCIDLLAATVEGLASSDKSSSVTGLLRKVRKSAGNSSKAPEVALLALGGLWAQYEGVSDRVTLCESCDYPPSLCGCDIGKVA